MRVTRLFQQYKQVVYLSPHLLDLAAFESELVKFLNSTEQVKSGQIVGPSLSWNAILFSVLAAGLQFSNRPLDERTLGSKRYGRDHNYPSYIKNINMLTGYSSRGVRLFARGNRFHYSKCFNNNCNLGSSNRSTK